MSKSAVEIIDYLICESPSLILLIFEYINCKGKKKLYGDSADELLAIYQKIVSQNITTIPELILFSREQLVEGFVKELDLIGIPEDAAEFAFTCCEAMEKIPALEYKIQRQFISIIEEYTDGK